MTIRDKIKWYRVLIIILAVIVGGWLANRVIDEFGQTDKFTSIFSFSPHDPATERAFIQVIVSEHLDLLKYDVKLKGMEMTARLEAEKDPDLKELTRLRYEVAVRRLNEAAEVARHFDYY